MSSTKPPRMTIEGQEPPSPKAEEATQPAAAATPQPTPAPAPTPIHVAAAPKATIEPAPVAPKAEPSSNAPTAKVQPQPEPEQAYASASAADAQSAPASSPQPAAGPAPTSAGAAKGISAWVKRTFPGHEHAFWGAVIGLIIALLVFAIGFLQTLFIVLLICLGAAVGQFIDGGSSMEELIQRIMDSWRK